MISSTTSLTSHKRKRILKKMIVEINAILQVLNLSLRGLVMFKHWVAVQELISVMNTNIVLLNRRLTDFEKELENLNK